MRNGQTFQRFVGWVKPMRMTQFSGTVSIPKRGVHKRHLLSLAFIIVTLLIFLPYKAIAQQPWNIDNEKVIYSPLPMNAAMMQVFIQEISNGVFTAPWSGTAAKVTWTSDCVVSIEAGIILPMFPDSVKMTESERTLMDAAVEALKSHELRQVQIWEYFAHEIKRYHCPSNSDEIKTYWQKQIDNDIADSNYGFKPYFASIKSVPNAP